MTTTAGRVALVTGAGRRVGQAIAVALGARGFHVAIHYNGSETGARKTLQLVTEAGGGGAVFQGDLSAAQGPSALIDEVMAGTGRLDVVVNSAAIMERTPFGEVTVGQWDEIMAINLRAPFFVAQAAVPALRRTRGVIVNIADLAAFENWPAYVPHGISKAGIVHMTRSLARVLAPEIRVCGVAPGTVLLPEDWDRAADERLRQTTPLGRNGSPADVSAAVLFLVDSDYITGETIVVDGGRRVRT